MDDTLKFAVNEGDIEVNHAARVIDHDDVKIWMCDLDTKHTKIIATSTTENLYEVLIGSPDYPTLTYPTLVSITGQTGTWHITAEVNRYTLIIVLFAGMDEELKLDYYKR